MTARFRRPASLSPARADQIPGAPDPAEVTDLAHRSAAALLDGVRHSEDPETVDRVVGLARTEGLGDLATLWSAAPADSLPGALWRMYVLHTWAQRDPQDLLRRYELGSTTVPGLQLLAGFSDPPDVDAVRRTLDRILRGAFIGDLGLALRRAGAVAVIAAHGSAHLADQEVDGERAAGLTTQARRLLDTGEDLMSAGRAEDAGTLT
ncbi:hypothetical protein JSY14_05240 [Brachybacterium sp. EF45031]|uniref:hypothetical protein n=1 Tax=Brachybacterium sillae TaxID=2810536 RepID=UPI00217D28BA|nr:hypothetical protein [Brachybacterium sillae]MCS6711456.1 hypothetical protein [Brachybacterium sillae]